MSAAITIPGTIGREIGAREKMVVWLIVTEPLIDNLWEPMGPSKFLCRVDFTSLFPTNLLVQIIFAQSFPALSPKSDDNWQVGASEPRHNSTH